MGLRAALVDRARIDRQVESTQKVQGRTKMVQESGPWFRARLAVPMAAESQDQGQSRKIARKSPSLMFDVRDADGNVVRVEPRYKLEVDSRELGRAMWEVVAAPEAMRKKRRVIGWTVQLRRVDEQERD